MTKYSRNISIPARTLIIAASIFGTIRADWQEHRLQLNAQLAGVSENSFNAHVNVPLQLEPESLALSMPPDQTIDGRLSWSGDIEPVWTWSAVEALAASVLSDK